MTAALFNNQGGNFANVVDAYVYPQFIGYALRAPTTQDIYPAGTRWQDNSVNPAIIYQTTGAGLWYVDTSAGGSFTSLTVIGPSTLTGITNINTTGSGVTSIGTGGTGAVNIGNATGNTAVTGNIVASGSITAGTGVTATTGNITATNGNIVKGTAGNKDVYTSVATTTAAGANSAGTVTLVGGTATISTTAITAGSKIRMTRQGIAATGAAALGILTVGTITAGVSFIINAVSTTDATALQASDVSSIWWEIVN